MSDGNLHPVMQAALAPHMPRAPRPGDLQVCAYDEYQPGAAGFVIEEFGYNSYPSDPPGWRLPAWDERGEGSLGGVFATRVEAERALRRAAQ